MGAGDPQQSASRSQQQRARSDDAEVMPSVVASRRRTRFACGAAAHRLPAYASMSLTTEPGVNVCTTSRVLDRCDSIRAVLGVESRRLRLATMRAGYSLRRVWSRRPGSSPGRSSRQPAWGCGRSGESTTARRLCEKTRTSEDRHDEHDRPTQARGKISAPRAPLGAGGGVGSPSSGSWLRICRSRRCSSTPGFTSSPSRSLAGRR